MDAWWWLRSPGNNDKNAAEVNSNGSLSNYGDVAAAHAVRSVPLKEPEI